MNKYELALVVSAKIEDDARTATVEKAKDYIVRAGGTVTEVEDWGKKKLAYDIQKMSEGYTTSSSSKLKQQFQLLLSRMSVSWTMFFVSYALEKTRHRENQQV